MKFFIVRLTGGCEKSRVRLEETLGAVLRTLADRQKRDTTCADLEVECIDSAATFMAEAEAGALQGARLLFTAALDAGGMNLEVSRLLGWLNAAGEEAAAEPDAGKWTSGARVEREMDCAQAGDEVWQGAGLAGVGSWPGAEQAGGGDWPHASYADDGTRVGGGAWSGEGAAGADARAEALYNAGGAYAGDAVRSGGRRILAGAVGGVLVDGPGDLYTKDMGRRLVFAANRLGCTFPGKALVEATGDLHNFAVQAHNGNTTKTGAYQRAAVDLALRMLAFSLPKPGHLPKILAVHASSRKTSNSLMLWSAVASFLEGRAEIEEISIRNGEVWDCRGCPYEECLHFGENSTCFYGGVMVEKVYPAIVQSDVVVLICPNYNDSVSANIMAFINRLTAVFRTNDFSGKRVYAIVVSGYSGGDLVAQQILGAMNMNKNFILPADFALLETANRPKSILQIDDFDEKARQFAENILCRMR